MARSRNIKPGFFKNEYLAQCKHQTRLLFIGLWTLADREGRLENRPLRIKAELFPYENTDMDSMLSELVEHGFIALYQVGGHQYIQILNFHKHQTPHIKEQASTIPAPDKHGASPSDSLNLIPDSPSKSPKGDSSSASPPDCPHEEIIDLYHEVLPNLRVVRTWSDTRKAMLRKRWRESPERQSLDWWRDFFAYVAKSDFLCGRTVGRDGRVFEADLEWLVSPKNFAKVIEGKYE